MQPTASIANAAISAAATVRTASVLVLLRAHRWRLSCSCVTWFSTASLADPIAGITRGSVVCLPKPPVDACPGRCWPSALMNLHRRRAASSVGARASSCRSSQHPQRGLIQTDPPLWVGSYYRRSLLLTREDRHHASSTLLSSLALGAAPQCVANAWFGDHFGAALPRGLREQADACPGRASSRPTVTPPARCGWGTGRAPTPSGPPGGWARRPATSRP